MIKNSLKSALAKENLLGEQGGHSLPPPTPHSPASHTYMAPSLPTPALHAKTDQKPGILTSVALAGCL